MKDLMNMNPVEIENLMDALMNEYTRRRDEFSEDFATKRVEAWIDNVQASGYGLAFSIVGHDAPQLDVKKWQLVMVDRQ